MANIAEGFGRGSKTEFIRFLWISHASAVETQSHVYVARDLGYLQPNEFEALQGQAAKVQRLISGLIRYLLADRARPTEQKNKRTNEPKNQEVFGRISLSSPLLH